MLRTLFTLLSSLSLLSSAMAASLEPSVQGEIDKLIWRLHASGCEFNRNGSWYTGEDAAKHLLTKLEYLKGKTTVKSTEQFIELAASNSSVSGKPYLVRCAGAAPVESQTWLLRQLKVIRGSIASPPSGQE